jgi:hypothetical protein
MEIVVCPLLMGIGGLSPIATTPIDCRSDFGGAAIGQAGTADHFVPNFVAGFGLELQIQRHFLGESAVAAEAFEMVCVCRVIGLPGSHDGLPQRPLERLVLFVKTVLPFQERRFRGR